MSFYREGDREGDRVGMKERRSKMENEKNELSDMEATSLLRLLNPFSKSSSREMADRSICFAVTM